MDYLCGDCGSENIVAASRLGSPETEHFCASCGSSHVLGVDLSAKYQRSKAPSVGQMLHRQRKAERNLPMSPMERHLLAQRNAEAAEDLQELLTELA